jgi:Amt family ammonium transporter
LIEKTGWLKKLGAIDFAGGLVVHISSGTSALVAAAILGPRKTWDRKNPQPEEQNIPFVVIGTALIWVGWAGFNAGSASAANSLASVALINTNTAAAAAFLTWNLIDAALGRAISVVGGCTGIVVGLVVITPAAGFIHPGWSILFGVIGTLFVYGALQLKPYLPVDDSLDVFCCHAVAGIVGSVLTGLFATTRVNAGGADGSFLHTSLVGYQIVGILVTMAFCSAVTAGILLTLKYTVGIRVSEEEEKHGLDEALHHESWAVVPLLTTEVENAVKKLEENSTYSNTPGRPEFVELSKRPADQPATAATVVNDRENESAVTFYA